MRAGTVSSASGLRTAISRAAIDVFRKHKRRTATVSITDVEEVAVLHGHSADELPEEVLSALAGIKDEACRLAVTLRLKGYSSTEASALTGVKWSAVRALVADALKGVGGPAGDVAREHRKPASLSGAVNGLDSMRSLHDHGGDLLADGFAFVCRYLTSSVSKDALTFEEADHYSSMGLRNLSIYEHGYPTSVNYFSHDKGRADGSDARFKAAGVKQPQGGCIFFAVDYDAAPEHIKAICEYFQGIRETLMPTFVPAVYGSGYVCRKLWEAGLVRATWLAQSHGWEEYSQWWPKAHVVQGKRTTWHGFDVDFDNALDVSVLWRTA